jgi:hypothetical protein
MTGLTLVSQELLQFDEEQQLTFPQSVKELKVYFNSLLSLIH